MPNTTPVPSLRRRSFLRAGAGVALSPIVLTGLVYREARADPATVSAAMALGAAVLNSMKQGGELGLLIGALDVKLSAVLDNQVAMMAAITEVNNNIDRLRTVVNDLPSETEGLALSRRALALSQQITDELPVLSKNASADEARAKFTDYRERINGLSYDLSSLALTSTQPPSLVDAAWYITSAAKMLWLYDQEHKINSRMDIAFMLNAIGNIIQSLEIMTKVSAGGAARGLQRYLDIISGEKRGLVEGAEKSRFGIFVRALLPADFDRPTAILADDRTTITKKVHCLRGKPGGVLVESQIINDLISETQAVQIGAISVNKWTTPLRRIIYRVEQQRCFGGYAIYQVGRSLPNDWESDTWTQVVRYREGRRIMGPREEVLSSDPKEKLEACSDADDAENGAPALYKEFLSFLATYAAHVAIESRLLALRARANRNIEICVDFEKALEARL